MSYNKLLNKFEMPPGSHPTIAICIWSNDAGSSFSYTIESIVHRWLLIRGADYSKVENAEDDSARDYKMLMILDEKNLDVAQVCRNGHLINERSLDDPRSNQNFCHDCGAETINRCQNPKCRWFINGGEIGPRAPQYYVPSFCAYCGGPFPWTAERIKAAQELAEEMENLDAEEREALKNDVPLLVRDGPRTHVAATRAKRLLEKAGKEAARIFREVLVDVLSETAAKILRPGP